MAPIQVFLLGAPDVARGEQERRMFPVSAGEMNTGANRGGEQENRGDTQK